MHETIKTTAAPSGKSTLDGYIRELIAEVRKPTSTLRWSEFPGKATVARPGYRMRDADGSTTTVTCDIDTADLCQYTLSVVDMDGHPIMGSTEKMTTEDFSALGLLYATIAKRIRTCKPEMENVTGYATPEVTNAFIEAMILDATLRHPLLKWTEDLDSGENRYVSDGLGKGCCIFVQQDCVDDEYDSYTMQYYRDKTLIASCTETAKLEPNPDCLLRELYHLIARNDLRNGTAGCAVPEIHRYIADVKAQQRLEQQYGDTA